MWLMNGVTNTLTIWPMKFTNEESPQQMKGCGMISSLTLFEGSETQEKKNASGPYYSI